MASKFLILASGLKAQKATKKQTALAKAAVAALTHPGQEIHVYELHTSVKTEDTPAPEPIPPHRQ